MEAISVQQENTMLELEITYLQQREQLTKINIKMENHTHEFWVETQ
jgi:hypothetical protein